MTKSYLKNKVVKTSEISEELSLEELKRLEIVFQNRLDEIKSDIAECEKCQE